VIELHSTPTPNGQKVMILLEECGLPWTHVDVSILTGEQFTPGSPQAQPQQQDPGPGGQ
jgi:GST-like protein